MEELAACAAETEKACDDGGKQMDKMEGNMDKVGVCVLSTDCLCVTLSRRGALVHTGTCMSAIPTFTRIN